MSICSVLVIDDTASARDTIAAQLASCDYELKFADGAEQARLHIAESAPDLILLDVMMPGTDGIQFCQELKRDANTAAIPVLLVTALDSREDITRGLGAGADEFLTKPTHGPELRLRLANLLAGKRYRELVERQHEAAVEEVERLRDQLLHMDRLATLGTFAAGVGHELNNIATALVAYSSLLLRQLEDGKPVQRDDVEGLAQASNHVAEQGRAILRLGAPQAADNDELIDLSEVVRSVTGMLKLTGRTKYASVCLELPEAPVYLNWNRTELEQILINLCANAADALEDIAPERRIDITVGSGTDDETASLTVKDNGSGMPPEVAERVFESFFTTKPVGKGTGLGLPVIKQIVESHGGRINIETSPDHGTSVAIVLPRS